MENVNDNNYGNTVKIQKYQCWKCEGKGAIHKLPPACDPKVSWKYSCCDNCVFCENCNGKGYIPLIPYEQKILD